MLQSLIRIISVVFLLSILPALMLAHIYLQDLQVFNLSEEDLKPIIALQPAANSIVYDKKGHLIGEIFKKDMVFIPFKKLPKDLVSAIIAIEDRNFWNHQGFEVKSMLRAVYKFLSSKGKNKQGASTITQQVVRHFLLPNEKSLARKVKEIFLARKLEKLLSKEKIFEIYTNFFFLGNGSYGVGSAAKRYFGKPLDQLGRHELALIAGLFQSPSMLNPERFPTRAKKRQMRVLSALFANHMISKEEAKRENDKPLGYKFYESQHGTFAPYFLDFVTHEVEGILSEKSLKNKGMRIYTTLDSDLQQSAEESLVESAPLLNSIERFVETKREKQSKTLEASLLSVNPKNGFILSMAGGRDYQLSQFNRATQMLRQPGSIFKPIVYAGAFLNGYKWSDIDFVSPLVLDGSYKPRARVEDFLKETTLLRAFYLSMNIPPLNIAKKISLPFIIQLAQEMGIRSPIRPEFDSVLGGSEVTMLDLIRVYSTIANQGNLTEPIAILKIEDYEGRVIYEAPTIDERTEQIIPEKVAFLLEKGMQEVLRRGTARQATHFSDIAVGKTGTSNDSKDCWFMGISPLLVTSVWVGHDDSLSIRNSAEGGTLALPLWMTYMNKAKKIRNLGKFSTPEGVVSLKIDPQFGQISQEGIDMWFDEDQTPDKKDTPWQRLSQSGVYRDPFN